MDKKVLVKNSIELSIEVGKIKDYKLSSIENTFYIVQDIIINLSDSISQEYVNIINRQIEETKQASIKNDHKTPMYYGILVGSTSMLLKHSGVGL